jgi:SRSO17 transposase
MEDGTPPRIDDTAQARLPTMTEATASMMEGGLAYVADMARRWAPYVARSESRQHALAYLRGWLRSAERKHSWHVAEVCGEPSPDGFPYVLSRADGDADAVRDELRLSISQHLGDPNGVLILDETGLVKKRRHSAGVARQYPGTAGTVEHCPIGVLLGDASQLGQALVDRERYGPPAWIDDRERGQPAGIPADRPLATTPPLARQMLARAVGAGVPAVGHRGRRVWP